jgi:hypothetical protein
VHYDCRCLWVCTSVCTRTALQSDTVNDADHFPIFANRSTSRSSQICELQTRARDKLDFDAVPNQSSRKSLSRLRLVSRELNLVVEPILFSVVTLNIHLPGILNQLTTLSNRDSPACVHARHLVICPVRGPLDEGSCMARRLLNAVANFRQVQSFS